MVSIRKRRGIICSVNEYPCNTGEVLRLVRIEYADGYQPSDEQVIWERECETRIFEPKSLPNISNSSPDSESTFDCIIRSARWLALSPFVTNLDSTNRSPSLVTAPFFGAIQAEDFQLVPLVRAIQMPRVSLLLADDVGLGKSIEAGLILTELIRRRRIRKVLVLCPASLRFQWQQELRTKFGLRFDVVDRNETHELRKQMGMDANPWRSFQRVITSLHYLKQPDVLEQFRALCEDQRQNVASLPWDLLILDEAHNCIPSKFGENSDLANMVGAISPYFEHRLFLTATPHNGYTLSFSGLLEQLDPVRFTQTDQFEKGEQARSAQVVVRRLKSEVNQTDRDLGRSERFANRMVKPLTLKFSKEELLVIERFAAFRKKLRSIFARFGKGEKRTGLFALEILNKRLLSCPFAFADSWSRFKEGLSLEQSATETELSGARRAVEEDLDDDAEMEGRLRHASRISGAWLQKVQSEMITYIHGVDEALVNLGLVPFSIEKSIPRHDTRFEELLRFIESRLRQNGPWSADERLIVFTEYKTTLDYLHRRLLKQFVTERPDRFRILYGGMPDATRKREEIKTAFNDPHDPVRILLATDSASEGQNLQETARLLLHWDIPWNPSRLDQRNGRLDRHGQAREVYIYHFTSEGDADTKFLGRILEKVEQIRTDLGSVSELFDAAFVKRFHELQESDLVDQQLSLDIEKVSRRSRDALPHSQVAAPDTQLAIAWLRSELGYSPDHLKGILEAAFGMSGGRLLGPDERGRVRLPTPIPAEWRTIIDEEVRHPSSHGVDGPLPSLVFDPDLLLDSSKGRPVFRPSKDASLLHLGHPLIHRALLRISQARYPGTPESHRCSRWIMRTGPVPDGADALFIITVEELANNDLREAFHHWCRSLRFSIKGDHLQGPLEHVSLGDELSQEVPFSPALIQKARDLWSDFIPDIEAALVAHQTQLTQLIASQLKSRLSGETRDQKNLFSQRLTEIQRELAREERDFQKRFEDLEQDHQLLLFEEERKPLLQDDLRREIDKHRQHHQSMKRFIQDEQQRVLEKILPSRYTLRGEILVLPVAVEIRFPGFKP